MTAMSTRSWAGRLAVLAGAVVLALALVACGDDEPEAEAATQTVTEPEVTLRLGYVTPPEHPYGIAVDHFVDQVKERSNGAIEITPVPSYRDGDVPLLADVRGGAIELASVSTATWDSQGATAFEALQAPFLITNYPLEREVITGDIGRDMLALAEEQVPGIVGLAIHEGGLRKPLGVSEPLVSPATFRGKSLRSVESRVLRIGLRSLGADPNPIPIGDVYSALDVGTVDGMEANLGLIQTFKFYEVARFVSNINFWPFPTALVISRDAFDQLTEEQQQVIRAAARTVPAFSIDQIFNRRSELPQTLCDEGVTFVEVSDANAASLEAAAQSGVDELSRDADVAGFIERIQELKDNQPELPAPPALPERCTEPAT